MKNFVVIDHSVKRIGGHNYEYAYHILGAAERQGYQPILAVNRRFFERKRLPASWRLYTPFRHTTYEVPKFTAKQKRLDPGGVLIRQTSNLSRCDEPRRQQSWDAALPTWLRRRLVLHYERQKQQIIERYADDLGTLFQEMQLQASDQVFVPTLSEDDLIGLLKFFRRHVEAASRVDWHLQFHFKVYEGRETSYEAHENRLAGLKQLIREVAGALPPGCTYFYTTTDILAAQYNRLGAAEFRALPYPVNPALIDSLTTARRCDEALRVTCAGGSRPEKGIAQLDKALTPLWRDYFDSGRLQLLVQTKRLGKLPAKLRAHACWDNKLATTARDNGRHPKIKVVRWPLSTEKYLDLIRQSHIGLLLYDAQQYYARCSGVMVEMLKAGVPVIVPAGCWMAEQIAEPIYAHREKLCETVPFAARLTPADADWEASGAQRYYIWRRDARLRIGGDAGPLRARLRLPPGASHLCIRFRWASTTPRGSYLELLAGQDQDNQHQSLAREIVGVRPGGGLLPIFFALTPAAGQVELTWRNAFDRQMLTLEHVEFLFLSAGQTPCPLGAVGLMAAGIDQVARLLRDIADNYDHYRRTAEAFAPAWGQWHSPEKVVRLLTEERANHRRSAA